MGDDGASCCQLIVISKLTHFQSHREPTELPKCSFTSVQFGEVPWLLAQKLYASVEVQPLKSVRGF